MKRRIISVLTFLLIVVCLTGCSTRITADRLEEFTEIAENIKKGSANVYTLPEGFTFEYEDGTQTGRIVITAKGEADDSYTQRATFDITQEEVQLEEIEEDFSSEVLAAVYIAVVIMVILWAVISLCRVAAGSIY